MKIKTFFAVVILSAAAITRVHAFGIGAQLNFSAGGIFAPGAALAVSPSDKINLAVNWYLGEKANIVGLTLDVVPLNYPFVNFGAGSLNFTLGVGVFANMVFTTEPGINGGLRIPVGLSLFLAKNVFEIYTHVAPSFGVDFIPSLALYKPFYPIALGGRIWLR